MATAKDALVKGLLSACVLLELIFLWLWIGSSRTTFGLIYHDGFIIFVGLTGTLVGYRDLTNPFQFSKALLPVKARAKVTVGVCLFVFVLGLAELTRDASDAGESGRFSHLHLKSRGSTTSSPTGPP